MRFLAVAAMLLLCAADVVNPAAVPESRDGTPWWHARHTAAVARVRQGHVGLVWLGDSITENWARESPQPWFDFLPVWEQFYGDRNAVNLGFKGDRTSHLLWRMQHGELDGIQPKAAVVLIGANNMGLAHWTAAQTLGGIEAVINELHRRLPQTRVLLISVLPSERSAYADAATLDINAGLTARYGHDPAVTYIDVTPLFIRAGKLDRTAFYDMHLTPPDPLLHPTAQAQARIAAAIEPALAGMMGDRVHGR